MNNIDSILEKRIKTSLSKKTSANFTDNVMKRIEIQEQFKKEDNVVYSYVRTTTVFILSTISVLVGVAIFVFSKKEDSADEQFSSEITILFSKIGEGIMSVLSSVGITPKPETFIYLTILILLITTIAFGEKLIYVIKSRKN